MVPLTPRSLQGLVAFFLALVALTVGMVPADPKPARRQPQTGANF